ncbi:metal-dependent hydrolase [Cytobacillus sp. IB215665]|uniref:metal-dependent hydrolase n=1 Tax=Cytobacillus sp. IB215665 TaxID=3097357 RepID=UPI002A12B850|nr:metal-dependent hydrolase [Cytobacillus sp. IB215665]MDX8367267.1 metal-dependent hydrolase [Cytobacillus sp. IB215665]
MDTGTHIVMGIAIGGLATLDPIAGADSITAQGIMIGAIVGSLAPDLDTILKFNNAKYIRNHRGITHSIPAVLLWPLLITFVLYFIFPSGNALHIWIWTFLAVILHVFVDIFNAYGTQALRPFTKKWVALGVINTFDPFIFIMHILGIFVWKLGAYPGYTFLTMYMIIAIYYVIRLIKQRQITNSILKHHKDVESITISPTFKFNQWHLAIATKNNFYVARAMDDDIILHDKYEKHPVPNSPIIDAAKKDENLSAFLSFSPIYRWVINEFDDYYEVKFIDLRYRSKGHYPFVAVVQLDLDLNIISSYTGWVFSDQKLRKKLNMMTY